MIDYRVEEDNYTLRTPSLFAINVIATHFFIINSFKMYTNSLAEKITIRGIFPLLIHLKTVLIHLQQVSYVIGSKEFESFVYSILFSRVIFVILYWMIILGIYFYFDYHYFSVSKIKLIIKRKYFHFLSLFIFIPGIKNIPNEIIKTLYLIVLWFFFITELFRNSKTGRKLSIMQQLTSYLKANIDQRDDTKLILTHIFLLSGISSSLFYSYNNSSLYLIGTIILGLGDSMCSIIGVLYGKHKIYPYNNRTLEGTIGGLLSTIILLYVIDSTIISMKSILGLIGIFLYEGITLEIDNLVLPLFANNLFILLYRV